MSHLIKFTMPDGAAIYAGLAGGGLGYAPTPATALRFETHEEAEKMLANGYGSMTDIGEVVPAEEPTG